MGTEESLNEAAHLHRAGDLAGARRCYRDLLATPGAAAPAAFGLGLIEWQEGRPDGGLPLIESAGVQDPTQPRYQMGLGQILAALQRWTEAAAAYRRAIVLAPQDPDAHCGLGNSLQMSGDLEGAIAAYRCALALRADDADTMSNLGSALRQSGQFDEALRWLEAAVERAPTNATFLINLAVALNAQERHAAAETRLREALRLAPNQAEAAYNLGIVLQAQARPRDALAAYQRALALRPHHAKALINLGNVHKALGEFAAAEAAYGAAMAIEPDSTVAMNNAGVLMRSLGRLDEAEAWFRAALLRDPGHAALYDNLGNTLKDAGRLGEAIECFRKSLAIDPRRAPTHSNLAYSLSFQSCDPEVILAECRRWNQRFAMPWWNAAPAFSGSRDPQRRLRVGYVSPDFRTHCQTLFTTPTLSHHDRAEFEIFAYADVERPDADTERLRALVDQWRDVRGWSDDRLATAIREDRIDILVDLTMHMAGNRLLTFARRPAPVQISWLAYPGTTGMQAIDYRLTDPRLDPPGSDWHYAERSIRLPDSFWCYDPLTQQPPVNSLPALERGYITFGCLNNPCKLTDRTVELWTHVLKAVPTARLLLMATSTRLRDDLARRFGAAAIDPGRLEFVGFRPREEYLRTYQGIDIGLDTIPYNGHTTSLDALWMGVPVISRIGATCVGRGGLSQLYQLGLTHLAADSDAGFVNSARALAGDLNALTELRRTLRSTLERSPLMDPGRFCRNLEGVYRDLWRDHCRVGGGLEAPARGPR
jgi:predicted O-linked N-acetylglucosamine transferase (SPINDLY family)